MPDWSVQRRFPRYQIQLPLLHRATPSAMKVGVGWTRDLSEGGACVELTERLEPRTPHWLRLQTDRGPIDVETRVAWAGGPAPAGRGILHGVAFIQVTPAQRQALQDLLLSTSQTRRAGVRLPLDLAVTCQPKDPAGPPLEGRTGDISQRGLLLRLPQSFLPGTVLELTLRAPGGALLAQGAVVWTEAPGHRTPGEPIEHGLQFFTLGWSVSEVLGLPLEEPQQGGVC